MFPLISFDEWWLALTNTQQIFWVIAGASSVLFIVFFGLTLLGFDADSDVDVDVDTDVDLDTDVGHSSGGDFSIDKDFSAFSVRSIIAFLTFFGWTGVYVLMQGHGVTLAVVAGLIVGAVAMFLVAYMIFQFARMEKSGTVNVFNALNHTGEVYLSIPERLEGRGKVHLIVDGTLHEFDAETPGLELPSGSQVRVVDILEDQVLLVEPLEKLIKPGDVS